MDLTADLAQPIWSSDRKWTGLTVLISWYIDPKRPQRFEKNINGINFHCHFYVKTIEIGVPQFFMHNILSITGVNTMQQKKLA